MWISMAITPLTTVTPVEITKEQQVPFLHQFVILFQKNGIDREPEVSKGRE